MAQMVAHLIGSEEVTGSIPVASSNLKAFRGFSFDGLFFTIINRCNKQNKTVLDFT